MDTLQTGISAARAGRREEARALLQQALQANPRSEQGWLWMSTVVETDVERRTCLERVLTINPHNQTAKTALDQLSAAQVGGDWTDQYTIRDSDQALRSGTAATGLAQPESPHSLATLGMDPAVPRRRTIKRLAPLPDQPDGLAQLHAAQLQPPDSPEASSSQADPFMALVLIGGLSITAIAGALMLGVLLLIGWPP